MQEYPVSYRGATVGSAQLTAEGLYYCIHGKVRLPDGDIYRLFASNRNRCICLGICVPDGDLFVITKRIPIKQFANYSAFSFYIDTREEIRERRLYSVSPDKPFEKLKDLQAAHFEMQDGAGHIAFD